MVRLTRRQALALTTGVATLGAGVTATQGLNAASISGRADVQAEQALTVTSASVAKPSEVDATFSRVSDDNTRLQIAVEANNGDSFTVDAGIDNASADAIAVRIRIETPSSISVESTELNGSEDEVVQSDGSSYLSRVPPTGSGSATTLSVQFKIADTAAPGARDIEIALEPLSTNDA
jgi:Tfp pilus assembly ATPase PilU